MSQNKIQKYMLYDNNIKNTIFVFLCLTNLQSHSTKVLLLLEHNNPLLFKKIDDYVHLVLFQKVGRIEMIKKHNPITF